MSVSYLLWSGCDFGNTNLQRIYSQFLILLHTNSRSILLFWHDTVTHSMKLKKTMHVYYNNPLPSKLNVAACILLQLLYVM